MLDRLGPIGFSYFLLVRLPDHNLLSDLFGWLSCYYAWLLLTPLLFRLERIFPLGRSWPNAFALALIGLPVSYCAYEITLFLNASVQFILRASAVLPTRWSSFPRREFALEQALYWFTVVAACLIRNASRLRDRERLAAKVAIEKAELETSLRRAD